MFYPLSHPFFLFSFPKFYIMIKLNTDIVRSNFPGLKNNWVFLDNAGGTQTARQVGDNINDYLFNSNVQLGASYEISQKSRQESL